MGTLIAHLRCGPVGVIIGPDMVHPTKIRLFIKPYCGWCQEVIDWLNQHQIAYETFDVSRSEEAWRQMMMLSGQTRVPVIEVDGHVLADFGATELAQWWHNRGFGLPEDRRRQQPA